jgi:hypothetical protein
MKSLSAHRPGRPPPLAEGQAWAPLQRVHSARAHPANHNVFKHGRCSFAHSSFAHSTMLRFLLLLCLGGIMQLHTSSSSQSSDDSRTINSSSPSSNAASSTSSNTNAASRNSFFSTNRNSFFSTSRTPSFFVSAIVCEQNDLVSCSWPPVPASKFDAVLVSYQGASVKVTWKFNLGYCRDNNDRNCWVPISSCSMPIPGGGGVRFRSVLCQ